ncbi:MAG: ATP-binding protein [Candidatus Thorarchaeota archaeon]
MRLSKLKIKNFRCYQEETTILIDDLTTIIGVNDIGKSAILEALDCFFSDNIEKADLSNNADNNSIELTCCFENIPEEIILDTSVPTSPLDEGILNLDKQLEVKKIFTFSTRKTTSIFLIANYPTNPKLENLLSLKNARLKNYAEELNVDLTNINRSKNPPIRKAIRDFIGGGYAIKELKVDGNIDNEDNIKTIWSSIKKLLPIYSLFKVDRALNDKDTDIQDPMRIAIKEALSLNEIQTLLEQVEEKVKVASTEVAENIIEKLKDIDESMSEKLRSDFNKIPGYDKIFDLTLLNENDIPLNKRGSGIKRLVLLSFFQAQAEKKKAENKSPSIIYGIEEPETSQHPKHQQLLIDSLIKLSERSNTQVIFTTHSANLVREIPIKSLRYISINSAGKISIENGMNIDNRENDVVINDIIKTLGILPNPTDRVKVLIYVEGNNDVNALKRYSQILSDNNPEIINLNNSNEIAFILAGGSSLKHYLEQKHLSGLGKSEIHIYDSDVDEYIIAAECINEECNPYKKAFITEKLEIENYLHHEAIIDAYFDNGINNLSIDPILDDMDVPLKIAEQLYIRDGSNWNSLDFDTQKKKADEKKKFLNTQAVDKMTIQRINDRNSYDEMLLWFNTIKQLTLS